MNQREFFECLFSNTSEGFIEIRTLPNRKQRFFKPEGIDAIVSHCEAQAAENVYFGIATREKGNGSKAGVLEIPALWCDVDFKETPVEVLNKSLTEFPFKPSITINSGGGYHLYWLLKEPEVENLINIEGYLKGIARKLGGDPNSAEIARVLRVPLTYNYKYNPPRRVLIDDQNNTAYLLTDFEDLFIEPINHNKNAISTNVVQLGIERILRCNFVQWCREHPGDLREPLWYALVSNLCRFDGGKETIHQYSKGYSGYSPEETNRKIAHALQDTSPHTCQFIRDNGFKCEGDCKVKAPAALCYKLLPVSLNELEEVTGKFLLLKDNSIIHIILATVLANVLDGDPLWMLIIGPPSNAKTEILRALEKCKFAYFLSNLTPTTLVSGMLFKNHDPSLIYKLNNKTLIVKDFGTLLTLRNEQRAEIFGQLREIYDGKYVKAFGNEKIVSWLGKMGLIAGATPIIDRYGSLHQALGERFLQCRVQGEDSKKIAVRALAIGGKEKELRAEMQEAYGGFFTQFEDLPPDHVFERNALVYEKLAILACLCALARTAVVRNRYSQAIEVLPEAEGPARLAKQFKTLGNALALIHGKRGIDEMVYRILKRVGRDTLPALRLKVIKYLFDSAEDGWLKTKEVLFHSEWVS